MVLIKIITLEKKIKIRWYFYFRRKTPHNFIFLGLFTVAEGFLLGCVVATYRTDEVSD